MFPSEVCMEFDRCREILLKETELVRSIAALQDSIYEAVISREWADFEGYFSTLAKMREEFALMEGEREQIFAGLRSETGVTGGFYALAAHLPHEKRSEITSAYRDLKRETLQVQMTGEALMGYIAGARATIAGFFEIAFPDRGGKIYSPHGKAITHDMRSMVLNQRF